MQLLHLTVPEVSLDGTLQPWYYTACLPICYPIFLLIAKGWLWPMFSTGAFGFAMVAGILGCALLALSYPRDPTYRNTYLHGIFTVMAFVQCIVWVMFSTGMVWEGGLFSGWEVAVGWWWWEADLVGVGLASVFKAGKLVSLVVLRSE